MKQAVLGLLIERRGYGYELVARLEDRLGPSFGVPKGTVYTALASLEADEHIRVVRRVMRGKRISVYYEPTPSGIECFDRWMGNPPSREPMRGEGYLMLAMVDAARLPALREMFERLELEILAEIAAVARSKRLADELADPVPMATAARWLIDYAVLDRMDSDLRWVRAALGILRKAEAAGTVPRATLLEAVRFAA